jgi:hypothetical protein
MSAELAPLIDDSPEPFAIDSYVSINLEHPLAQRYTASILRVPMGRVTKTRFFEYGLIKTTKVHQCYVAWEVDGAERESSWVDSSHLLPLEEVVQKIHVAIKSLENAVEAQKENDL